MSFANDMIAARGQDYTKKTSPRDTVVAPVDPKALNQRQSELVDPAGAPLSPKDLKVVGNTPQTSAEPKVTLDSELLKTSLIGDEAIVDMSSLLQPIGEAPAEAVIPTAGETQAPQIEISPSTGETTPPPVAKSFKVGDREFPNAEEALAYANGLAKNAGFDLSQLLDPAKLAPPTPEDPDPADIMFEDPKRAVAIIKKQATAEIRAELRVRDEKAAAAEATARGWQQFYASNPDLVGFEDIVQTQVNAVDPRMPIEAGLALAAKNSRDRIEAMRKRLIPTETVSSRVVSAPANKVESAPAPKAPNPKPLSFTDEIRGLNRSRKAQA